MTRPDVASALGLPRPDAMIDLAIASLAFVFAARGLRVALQMYFALLAPFFRLKLVPLFLYFLFFFGGEEVGVALLSSEVRVPLLSLEGRVVLLSLED
jgi:hypothetical protein